MTDSVARIKLNDAISVEVVDPDNVAPVYADLVTELRVINGTLHLSLASLLIDGDDPTVRTARVVARLRIAPSTLQFIQQALNAPTKTETPSGQTLN